MAGPGFTREQLNASIATRRRKAEERKAASADGTPAAKEPARIPSSVIRWVADQLEPLKEGEAPKSGKPPNKRAANLLAKCRSSEKMELLFWGKVMAMEQAESVKKEERQKMEDDQRESFSLIEMWKKEMPGYPERKALHDAAQAEEAEKRQQRARRLAEFQSGGPAAGVAVDRAGVDGGGKAETQAEAPQAETVAGEDRGSEDAGQGDGGDAEGREEARAEAEGPAESEAAADRCGLAAIA